MMSSRKLGDSGLIVKNEFCIALKATNEPITTLIA